MKTTLKWLQGHCQMDQTLSIDDHINKIEQCFLKEGLEIDNITHINPIYIGKILKIEQPKKMKVQVCQVQLLNNQEKQIVQVLCGADNIYENMYVILALSGTKLSNGIIISTRKINKIESYGMILSGEELGFVPQDTIDHPNGVLEYTKKDLGLVQSDDVLFDISTPANRIDLKSTRGLARLVGPLKPLSIFSNFTPNSKKDLRINNNYDLAIAIGLVNHYKINEKVLKFMERIGKASKNILQTLNDFIILDIGHPINIFDQKHIIDHQFSTEKKDNYFSLYSGTANKIADIGHKTYYGYDNNTTNIAIEVAYPQPLNIKDTSTISSSYFALGVDQEQEVLLYVLSLLSNSEAIFHPVYSGYKEHKPQIIYLTCDYFYKKTGKSISLNNMKNKLEKKYFNVKYVKLDHQTSDVNQEFAIAVEAPSWRTDIKNSAHIIEEIVRDVYVYTNKKNTNTMIQNLNYNTSDMLERDFVQLLYQLGFEEVVCYPFTNQKYDTTVTIINPMDHTKPYLQTNLMDNMVQYGCTRLKTDKQIKIFQIGYVFNNQSQISPKKFTIMIGGKADKNIIWQGKKFQGCHFKYYIGLLSNYIKVDIIKKTNNIYICEGVLQSNLSINIDMNGKYFDVSFLQPEEHKKLIWSDIAALTKYPLILFDHIQYNNRNSYSATHYCPNQQEHQTLLNKLQQLNMEIR